MFGGVFPTFPIVTPAFCQANGNQVSPTYAVGAPGTGAQMPVTRKITLSKCAWTSELGNATTQFGLWVNGALSTLVNLTAISGVQSLVGGGFSFNAGDIMALQYRAGTAPGGIILALD
jgi:hypothetical protein